MRIAALILGILGGLLAGLLGAIWFSDASQYQEQLETARAAGMDMEQIESLMTASYFLLLAPIVGLVGGVLALRGKGLWGAALMVPGAIAPVIFAPVAAVFTAVLGLGGILSLFAKPKLAA